LEEKLIDKIGLKNGLTLILLDASRPVAGDRWQVSFIACAEVDVKAQYFTSLQVTENQIKDIRSVVGNKVLYRYEKNRNFIAAVQKDEILNGLKDRFLETNLEYLSDPDFPGKLILSRYKTVQTSKAYAGRH